MRLALLVLLALLVGEHGSAWAEKAKAKDGAKVFNRAGEQGKVLFKLKEGQVMRVLKEDGRWYKVNVKGRTGWIPRSKVEVVAEQIARNSRRRPFVDGRGTTRGPGGDSAPDDRIGADAAEPDDEAPKGGTKPKKKVVGSRDKDEDADEPDEEPTDDEVKPKGGAKPKPTAKPKAGTKPKVKDKEEDEDTGDTDADEPKVTDEGDEVTDERPKVKLVGKATIFSEPDSEADPAEWKGKDGMVLFVNGKKGKFTEVENEDSDIGYVLTSKARQLQSQHLGGYRLARRRVPEAVRQAVRARRRGEPRYREGGPGHQEHGPDHRHHALSLQRARPRRL